MMRRAVQHPSPPPIVTNPDDEAYFTVTVDRNAREAEIPVEVCVEWWDRVDDHARSCASFRGDGVASVDVEVVVPYTMRGSPFFLDGVLRRYDVTVADAREIPPRELRRIPVYMVAHRLKRW